MTSQRIGIGHDRHRLVEGRPLVLGGVRIDHTHGLEGHSDADIVLHALTDALLGAAGLGDIGDLFPDTEAENKGRDSVDFVREAVTMLRSGRWSIVNVDMTLFAQEPKLGVHKQTIRARIAELLGLDPNRVNLKAKTGERVGVVGREEAMDCQVIALIEQE